MGKCSVDSLLTEPRDTRRCLSETFREKNKKTPYFTCLTSKSSGSQAVS